MKSEREGERVSAVYWKHLTSQSDRCLANMSLFTTNMCHTATRQIETKDQSVAT